MEYIPLYRMLKLESIQNYQTKVINLVLTNKQKKNYDTFTVGYITKL
jgi:hypothetical protein